MMTSCATKRDHNWMRMVKMRGGTGMTSGLNSRSSSFFYFNLLPLLDTVFSMVVAAPAVVGYWRGTWGLSEAYLYPGNETYSSWASIVIGLVGLFFFNVVQHVLNDFLQPSRPKLVYLAISRAYTLVFGICCVNAWRGVWQALELSTEHTTTTVLEITAASLAALFVLRSVRNISAPPFSLCLDSRAGYFEVQTRFHVDHTRQMWLYILDCAFSVGVVGTLVVFVWRGAWKLVDLHLYPEDAKWSAIVSLMIGYGIVLVTFCMQTPMRLICARFEGCVRLIFADLFLILSFAGTVNVWRGIWMALELWLVPDDKVFSCWITSVGCFVFLVLLRCSNSILVRGVYIDGKEDDGKCVAFPCHYFRNCFQDKRERMKTTKQRNLLVATNDFTDGPNRDTENGVLLPNSTAATIAPVNPESLV